EYDMIFQFKHAEVGLAAGELGLRLIRSLLPPDLASDGLTAGADAEPFDWATERDAFIRLAQRHAFGPSTQSLVDAAERRGIPWLRLNGQSLVQLGHGRHQKRVQATVTSETRHIAVEIASDKEETRGILAAVGLPVPRQELVYSADGAIEAAAAIGYPVVTKPLNANHGRGISIHLTTPEQVEAGFAEARQHGTSRGVLVESFVTGFDHRMLVVNGALVAVAKRVPGHVVGDGQRTVEALVADVNADPRRGVGHEKVLTQIMFDDQAERLMAQAGVTRDSVLEDGQILYLRSTANLSTGGTAIDLTDVVHPDNREMAVRAVRAVGLDVGGVDFLTDDIAKSYKDVGGAIVEVNAAPGFRMHVAPSEGTPRDVAVPVMDMLFPRGAPARIPIIAVTGTNGKTTTTRMVAHVLQMAGNVPGMTSTDGVFIDGRLSVRGDMTGPSGAQMVLRDPFVDSAVLEVARGGLVRSGLGFSRCDVAACLNVTSDHLGLGRIDTLDQLAAIKRVPIEVARTAVVLNADDPRVLAMAEHSRAKKIVYVTMDADHSLVREHVREGGRAVVLERGMGGEMITLFDAGRHIPLLWTHLIPATIEGKATHNVQNAMFAAAICHAIGDGPMSLTLDQIRHGLRTFTTSFYEAPGRLNVYDEHPFKVILDYAHNPAAVEAMGRLVDKLDVKGLRRLVISAPGDRRDEDVIAVARAAAPHFDTIICKQDDRRRGRDVGEIPTLLRDTLIEAGLAPEAVEVIPDEQEAVARALSVSRPGDLLVVFGDAITRCWKQIVQFDSPHREAEVEAGPPALLAEGEAFALRSAQRIARDDRGVHLVTMPDEEAD
ncbi:MAG TPA: cyanophycin synthetase, partial [Rubricoccaceae bacterium]